jgi:hypothetical protein
MPLSRISAGSIADGTVVAADIANSAITTVKIADNAVSNTKLATGSVENYLGTQGFALGMRNRIINGDMRIDQRNAGASVTPTDGQYIVDRWQGRLGQASKYSVQQNAGSVTPPVGFTNYLGATSLSAYSVISTDYFALEQPIEGFNIADLGWGTANAKTVTLSFWVRSSLTGTFGVSLQNAASNRSYPATYTISSADTWEYKTISIVGDTSGTWVTNNGFGVGIFFGLGMGSSRNGTNNTWNSGNFLGATGATSVVGTNGATWYITGVQLEVGSVATPFERRPYGTELALCQRYFFNFPDLTGLQLEAYTTTVLQTTVYFPVPMRTNPTIATISSDRIGLGGVSNITTTLTSGTTSYRINTGGSQQATIRFTSSASLTAGLSYIIFPNAVDSGASFSAEL